MLCGRVTHMTGTSSHTVQLPGDAGLRAAQDIAAALREAITANSAVTVDTSAVTSADLTTIQLLLSARKFADHLGRSLSLAAAPQGPLQALLTELGFLGSSGQPLAEGSAFWTSTSSVKGKAQ